MKPTLVAAAAILASSPFLLGETILYYDSVSGGTANALDRLDSQTHEGFVAWSSTTTTLGRNAVFAAEHASQSNVQGLGDGRDKMFRFGSSAGGSGTMAGTLRVAHMANGPYLEVSFTAARDLILDELSFNLFNNSNNGANYGARDAGLFVKVSSADFSQFGDLFTSPTRNGNHGTVTFSDRREVSSGDLVVMRIAFTDRTRANNDLQAATRIGAIHVSASPGTVSEKFRVLTYNIHGGKGPNGEGTPAANLKAFRDTLMQNEDVLCLQEVDHGDCWTAVQSVFSDYPYRYRTINQETSYWPWETPKQTSIAILSKYPFVSTHSQLIQTDPAYDRWERHAQHVVIHIGGEPVDLFHYHNTYNFNDNDWEYEKSGMTRFRDYVYSRLGITSLADGGRLLMVGDFNLLQANVAAILPTPERLSNGRDHVSSVPRFAHSGSYAAVAAGLSDHPAVWASLDLAAPMPRPVGWASVPEEVGTTAITMAAEVSTDPNGVQYYFTNTSVGDGSHDSGWQADPVFTDTGLNPGTAYTYTVKTRDTSLNANETASSAAATATTDDGDPLPDDWELSYFSDLDATAGGPSDDWDQDGSIDLDEWIAGTDPSDPASRFRAWVGENEFGETAVFWSAVAGKTYRIESSSSLTSGWLELAADLPAVVPETSFTIDPADGPRRFYRVEVEP